MGYRINGNDCTKANGCAPSKHTIGQAAPTKHATVGGIVLVEPVNGPARTHTWVYDGRDTETINRLLGFLGLNTSPVVIIDTYDIRRDSSTHTDLLLHNVVCTCEIPEVTTAERRSLTEGFSLVFSEIFPQT